jgi:hypothetical protein
VTVQEHATAYCRSREAVKLFRILPSLNSLRATCDYVQNCSFHDCTGTFIADCRYREVVKLFRILPSLNSIRGTYNSVQNCTFHSLEWWGSNKFIYYFRGHGVMQFESPWSRDNAADLHSGSAHLKS